MPRILDVNAMAANHKLQQTASELSSEQQTGSYKVVRHNHNYSVLVPLQSFTQNNNNNNLPLNHHRQQPRRPSVQIQPAPVSLPGTNHEETAATVRQEKRMWSPPPPPLSTRNLIVDEESKEKPLTVFQKIRGQMTLPRIVFILIGMAIVVIPLIVLSVLLANNLAATTITTTTISATTDLVVLPTQCYVYGIIANDPTRVYPYSTGCCTYSTDSYTGWYRFMSTTGATHLLTTSFIGAYICGSYYGGWWNGTLPTTVGQTNVGAVCFAYSSTNCVTSVAPVSVTNCNGYYVNYLQTSGTSYTRYCTTAN